MKRQLNKQIKGYQKYNSYLPLYARAELQTDIVDMNKFKKEEDERYALIAIHVFNKHASLHRMMNRSNEDELFL